MTQIASKSRLRFHSLIIALGIADDVLPGLHGHLTTKNVWRRCFLYHVYIKKWIQHLVQVTPYNLLCVESGIRFNGLHVMQCQT